MLFTNKLLISIANYNNYRLLSLYGFVKYYKQRSYLDNDYYKLPRLYSIDAIFDNKINVVLWL